MSAWIVDKANIDLLVEAFFRYEIPATADLTPTLLGHLLWKENHRSVNYRYSERKRTPQYHHESDRQVYQHHPTGTCGTVRELARNGLFVFMQLGCYDYQSCEHPGWESSAAYQYIRALEAAVLKGLGMTGKEAYAAMNRSGDEARHIGQVETYPWSIAY